MVIVFYSCYSCHSYACISVFHGIVAVMGFTFSLHFMSLSDRCSLRARLYFNVLLLVSGFFCKLFRVKYSETVIDGHIDFNVS